MSVDLIRERLATYHLMTREDEEHALKEMLQEILLFALTDSDFFQRAIFHGGTSLRIHHRLPRFSEDLDFLIDSPDTPFLWENYTDVIMNICHQFGITPEIQDRHQTGRAMQSLFIKDNSIGKFLALSFQHDPRKKLAVKLEIDTNPPPGTGSELKFLDFPVACSLRVQDLPSGFALKNHAILCRTYAKGRDWYDFYWYIKRKTPLNFVLMKNALNQLGPWAGHIDETFALPEYFELLRKKIDRLDWKGVVRDLAPFLSTQERKSLAVWDKSFFLAQVENLEAYLVGS
jgi:predicted nucleotidyltransferase component of viral defense system